MPVTNKPQEFDYFGFQANTGGLFNFEGVLANSKEITNIEINSDNVTVNYKDKNKYVVTADIANQGSKKIITKITEKWNKQDPKNNVAIEGILAMLLFANKHPDKLTYTDNDESYVLPDDFEIDTGETFDTVKETWKSIDEETEEEIETDVVWGVGVINKNQDNEKVNRLIYPDFSYISLINFGGGSGLG